MFVKLNDIGGTDLRDKNKTMFYKHTSKNLEMVWLSAKERNGTALIQNIPNLQSGIWAVGAKGFIDHVDRLDKDAEDQEKLNNYTLFEELAAGLIVVSSRLDNLAK